MDDLDRFLTLELARMLDPIVAVTPPRRRRRRRPQLTVMISPDAETPTLARPGEVKIDAIPLVVDPVAAVATGSAAYS